MAVTLTRQSGASGVVLQPAEPAESVQETPTAAEIIDAIDRHMMGQLEANGVQDYMIGDKRITRYDLRELRELRNDYEKIAAKQASGLKPSTAPRYFTRMRPVT
jgi:hypothetical protein